VVLTAVLVIWTLPFVVYASGWLHGLIISGNTI